MVAITSVIIKFIPNFISLDNHFCHEVPQIFLCHMFRRIAESSTNKPFVNWKLMLLSFSLIMVLFAVISSDICSVLQSTVGAALCSGAKDHFRPDCKQGLHSHVCLKQTRQKSLKTIKSATIYVCSRTAALCFHLPWFSVFILVSLKWICHFCSCV